METLSGEVTRKHSGVSGLVAIGPDLGRKGTIGSNILEIISRAGLSAVT